VSDQGPEKVPQAGDGEAAKKPGLLGNRLFREITGVGVDWRSALLVPLLAVLTALIVGAIIIAVTDVDALRLWGSEPGQAWHQTWTTIWHAYKALFVGAFWGAQPWSETLLETTPYILAGLSVAIGFRAGLFNIGPEGQILMGGLLATIIGFYFHLPMYIHLPFALLGGIIGGALWGGIPGLLRAKTGAHEVITTIMFNWIAWNFVPWALKTSFIQQGGRDDPVSKAVQPTAMLPRFSDSPTMRVNIGIILTLVVAALIFWLLYRTTLGYQFRAVGFNPDGAHYAGMNTTMLYTGVMAIAGALAGLAGAMQILGPLERATPGFSSGIGFDAIALALLGRSHPAGVVLAGLLFGALKSGGRAMQVATSVPIDLIKVVQALIVVFIAAPALIRAIYRVRTGNAAERITKGWAA
jgi:general nucleoside transport system permease protein